MTIVVRRFFATVALVGAFIALFGSLAGPAHAQEADQGLRGDLFVTIEGEREPVEGVIITVTLGGEQVAVATTDAEGTWAIDLAEPGTYTVSIDVDTLPDGVDLRDPETIARDVEVAAGRTRTVLFPLGEPTGLASGLFDRLAQSLFNGIKFGLIIAITSIGLSLVYGTTRLVNFSHGEMISFGAIVAWWLSVSGPLTLPSPGMHLIPAALLAVVLGGAMGAGMERGLWRPLRDRRTGLIQMLVISIGMMLLLRYTLLFLYGGSPRPYRAYAVMTPFSIGSVTTNVRDLLVMGLSTATLVAIGLMILKTRVGKAMRAVSDNIDLAEASGIDVKRVILWIWIMAGGLASLGGVFLGTVENVNYLMGFRLLLLIFAGVILGGIGTAFGAMVGGIVIGIITEMSILIAPGELKLAWGLVALVVVLLVRPQGIFGERERIG